MEARQRCRRRTLERSSYNQDLDCSYVEILSHQSRYRRSRERLNDSRDRNLLLSRREREGRRNTTMDAMSQALRRIARSPFSEEIKCTKMLRHFTHLSFTCFNGNTDPVEHVSPYMHLMALYSQNDKLLCKVFPSSLGPTMMRWFNDLRKVSIHNFGELI